MVPEQSQKLAELVHEFSTESVPESALESQLHAATDPL